MHFKYIRKLSNGAHILSLLSQIICFNFNIWKLFHNYFISFCNRRILIFSSKSV